MYIGTLKGMLSVASDPSITLNPAPEVMKPKSH